MADGSIFSSIMGDMIPFGDAVASRLENSAFTTGNAAAERAQSQQQASEYRSFLLEQRLNRSQNQSPYGPASFRAGQSQPSPSVNSDSVNQQWLQRLNRYASMPDYQGGRMK